jgi:hypothetical protein
LAVGLALAAVLARLWEPQRFLLVTVSDTRAWVTTLPGDEAAFWDHERGDLTVKIPEDLPTGRESVVVAYFLRGGGLPLESRLYRVSSLPFDLDLRGFPGGPTLRLLEVRRDGVLVGEWAGSPWCLPPGSEWSEISVQEKDGRRVLAEGGEEVAEAVRARSNMARIAVFNAGWKRRDEIRVQ